MEKILSKNLKIKLSTNLTVILNIEDYGIDTSDLNVSIPFETYPEIIEKLEYMDEDKLIELKKCLDDDYKYLVKYRSNKILDLLDEVN